MNLTQTGAAILLTLGGLLSLANWGTVLWSRRSRRFQSPVPLLGAAMLGAGMLLLPAARPYAWSALLLDYGTLAVLLAAPKLGRELWSTSRVNLLHEYVSETDRETVHLRLFRRGVFTLRLNLHRPPGECGLVSTGMIGTWQREGARLTLRTEHEEAVWEVVRERAGEVLRQSAGFDSWERSVELSLAGLELVHTGSRGLKGK